MNSVWKNRNFKILQEKKVLLQIIATLIHLFFGGYVFSMKILGIC